MPDLNKVSSDINWCYKCQIWTLFWQTKRKDNSQHILHGLIKTCVSRNQIWLDSVETDGQIDFKGFITWRYWRCPNGLSTERRKASRQPFLKKPGLCGSDSVLVWVAFSSPVKIICTFDSVPWLSMFPVWTTTWEIQRWHNVLESREFYWKWSPHRNNGLQPGCPSSNEASAPEYPSNPCTLPR